ncbi:hypothetical protein BH23GEM9_BH23GEM9_32990 [soil metagenome]
MAQSDSVPEKSDIVVFQILGDSACSECGEDLGKGRWLRMEGDRPLCMHCADLSHLIFVPAGNAALTRRAAKYSPLRAVLVRFSRTRKRYERQGILVEENALLRADEAMAIAEHACLKYSGRVGRSADAKEFAPQAIDLAVRAHVRHRHTPYDSLLGGGLDRHEARFAVAEETDIVIERWRQPG